MDEALEISVAAILKGEYPYYLKTYLGAPITPMPGAILLSSPFVLSGLPQFQNLFWLLLFALVVFRFYGKDTALAALGVPVLLSPTVIHNLVIGSDYISNGISVLLCMLWVVQSAAFSSRERTSWLLPALCLGITLSSRLIFLPLLLPLSYFLNVHVSWRYALSVGLAAIFSFLLITIPFYLYDPAGFSPLHVMSFVGRFEAQLPGARILMLALTLFSGAIPFIVSRELSEKKLFLSCAILLIAPVVINLFFSIIIGEKINLFYSFYGIFAVFFGSVFLGLSERSSIVCQPETESRKRSLAGTGDSLC